VEELTMTSTTIRPADRLAVTLDTAPTSRPTGRKVASAILVGVVAVMGVTAGVTYAISRASQPDVPTRSGQTQGFGDATESAHGTRAGVDSGTGLALATSVPVVSNDTVIAHGAAGSIRTMGGQQVPAVRSSSR
jgi:hypothetical protein